MLKSYVTMIGITTYIFEVLQRGQKAVLPPSGSGVNASDGLAIGRYTDLLIRRVISKKVALDPQNRKHRRAFWILRALKQAGITFETTQVPVNAFGIKTYLDGVGRIGDCPVIIEIKTTQHNLADFRGRYNTKCTRYPRLTNGMPNTTAVRYGLQASFGAIALSREKSLGAVKSVVVVGASDGAQVYWIDRSLQNPALFPQSAVKVRGRQTDAVFQPWPIGRSADIIGAVLRRAGVHGSKKGGPASGTGEDKHGVVVIGITGPVKTSRRQKLSRALRDLAIEHRKRSKRISAVLVSASKASPSGFVVTRVLKHVRST